MSDETSSVPEPASLEVTVGTRRWLVPPGRSITIGRDTGVDVYVADRRVSRQHAVVTPTPDGWLLTDHSRNGLFVNGQRVDRLPIVKPIVLVLGEADGGPSVSLAPTGERSASTKSDEPRPTHARQSTMHSVSAARMRIGRLPDNDIVLDDLLVSRRHAMLHRGDDGWRITDLGSANGTYLNGQPVADAAVAEGDVIGVGHALLRLTCDRLVEYVDTGDVDFEALDLVVVVGGKKLIDRVSFSLPERSLLAVIGPSGAGKSTLLKALTGFRPADTGDVRYGGRDLYANYGELRQRIGLVPQDDILHPQLKVRRALSYAAQLRFPTDVAAAERDQRITEVLDELGLTAQATQRIDSLSGGQRKRTSVALELLTRPSLLFLDEPTSGLDPGLDKSVMQTLRALADDGRTVVVVTHSVANLDQCDRLLILAPGGHVAYFGPPRQALDYFAVADFAEVFLQLDDGKVDWSARFRASELYERSIPTGEAHSSRTPDPPAIGRRQQSALTQFAILCRRTLEVIIADRQYAIFLAVLPLLLSGLARAVPSPTGLSTASEALEPQQLLLVLIIGGALMGAGVSIRELVKEREIYRRERAMGLSLTAYLGSKLAVLGLVTGVQAAVFAVLSMLGRRPPDGAARLGWASLEVVLAIVAAALASMVIGLAISAAIDNADRGMPLLVLLVMLQLIMSGGLVSLPGHAVLEQMSWVLPSRWAFAMGAATTDMGRIPPPANDWLWKHQASSWDFDAAVLGAMTLVLVGVTAVLLRRLDPVRRRSG
jgi:ABC-type multidrug transport system ATPase subunit/pSer/pThr/pTyr-binding forkhead associated (FHA) protein